ncbi:MAG: NAD(P)-dependent glycerol-3-phosphate dehydrogenase [Acidiferrobacterales bacterium]|nr:NAD(P)-dependent glycerol-3-phosphate dehydrogenase [Acidiferrobacterales bacterium]
MAANTKVAVLGAGSWGTALAFALARNEHEVSLWGHREPHCFAMQQAGGNEQYLEGFSFPGNLRVNANLADLVIQHDIYLIVTPSHAFRETLKKLKELGIKDDALIIWATKGFDKDGPVLLSEVVRQELGNGIKKAIVSGPSFSKEVAADLPTAIASSGDTEEIARYVAELFMGNYMRVYTNPDFIAVQVGGAIKNVMAIAAGISDGLGYGANSRAAIITRGLAEIARLGVALGANVESFQGLAGMGDLVLTCTDDQSRNRRLGLGLGKGQSLEETLDKIGQEVEGYTTTPEVVRLAKKHQIEMPICEQVYAVLYEGVAAPEAVSALLTRQLSQE